MRDKFGGTECVSRPTELEDIDHLFLKCHLEKAVWEGIFKWWNLVQSTYLESKKDIWGATMRLKGMEVREAWKATIATTLWSLWLVRNGEVFRRVKKNFQPLLL